MDLKLERTVIKAEIYGQQVSLSRPKFGKALALESELSKLQEAKDIQGQISLMKGFLAECGCPSELVDELEIEHLSQLIEVLSGSKKK